MIAMIPFTQFLRPDGKKRQVEIVRPGEILAKAKALLDRGFHFSCEELQTGYAVFYCEHPDEEEPVATAMCPNGPKVPETVDKLIETAHSKVIS